MSSVLSNKNYEKLDNHAQSCEITFFRKSSFCRKYFFEILFSALYRQSIEHTEHVADYQDDPRISEK